MVPIFVLDLVVIKTQKLSSSHRGFLNYAMHRHREKSNQINTL